jgi:putative transcriptional regulator
MSSDNWSRLDEKTDEEIAAAAASDPDCPAPMTPEQLSKMRRLSLAKLVRQKLRMSRESFSEAYGIPLDTLDAWERHEAIPTAVEESYLRLIEREPERAKAMAAE